VHGEVINQFDCLLNWHIEGSTLEQ